MAYKTNVRITIYNSGGEMIDKLVDEEKGAGTYEVEFSVPDEKKGANRVSSIGNPVSIPLFCQMKAGNYLSEKEMTLVG